ncbi:TIGR03619 family F420-dependent LLM class oxidoreductase [Kitasatospora sp. NPDC127059]|uniref:TIGR03619 family F420-dependent LLM class oxidoreductase n=1 Tax=unclassified Kitasatospora TaxID=2633591 RepID=UPI00365BFD09
MTGVQQQKVRSAVVRSPGTERRLRVGGDLPYFDDPVELRDYVQAFEGLGYDHLGFGEHVVSARTDDWPSEISPCAPWHESFVQAAYLAAITSRVELTASVLLPQRPVALAAKQAAEVDLLSGGRLRLSVSVGWNRDEVRALGVDPAVRGRLIEEQIEAMRLLWDEPFVDYPGQYVQLSEVALNPRPQRPLPLWMGGGSFADGGVPQPAVLDRMARLADGFRMFGPLMRDTGAAVKVVQRLRELVAGHGRDADAFGIEARIPLQLVPEQEWAPRLADWREAGASHVTLSNRRGAGGVQAEIARLARFAELTRETW